MKRYASHFLFLPEQGYLKQYMVEVENGLVVNMFPLTEEVENVEWLPGAIFLTREEGGLSATYFSHFDFTTMRPVAGTPHRLLP